MEDLNFETNYGDKKQPSMIKVLGVGGAGGNAVQHMMSDIQGVDFMICNTDRQALEAHTIPTKLMLGELGLGAGSDPKKAQELAEASADKIREMIGEETKMLFLTAGMGKGTGTGATPIIARIAHEMNILTIAVVTYPYELEQKNCCIKADNGLDELRKYVDSLIVIHNQKILEEYEDETLLSALGHADDVLKNAVKCIADLITVKGYQNVDFNDVYAVLHESGEAMLGMAEASGENRIEKVVTQAMTCNLIDDDKIFNAKNFLFFITYGEGQELTVKEMKKLISEFKSYQNEETNVIWGHAVDKSLGDSLKLSVIITNFGRTSIGHDDSGEFRIPKVSDEPVTIPEHLNSAEVAAEDTFSSGFFTPAPEVEPVVDTTPSYVSAIDLNENVTPTDHTEDTQHNSNMETTSPQPSYGPQIVEDDDDKLYEDDKAFKEHVNIPAYLRQQSTTDRVMQITPKTLPNSTTPRPSYSMDNFILGVYAD